MSFNSFQNTLEQLENAKNLQAETDFSDTIQDINDKASEETGFFGDIEKAGASVGGVVMGVKSLKGLYDKIQTLRKGKSDTEEKADDDIPQEDIDKAFGTEAEQNEPADWLDGVKQTETSDTDMLSSITDKVQDVVKQVTGADEQTVTDTPLEPSETTISDTELGSGTEPTTEPSGLGSGDIELAPLKGATQQPSTETDLEGFTGEGEGDAADVISNLTSKTVSGATDVLKGASTAAEEGAAETAGTIEETVGDVADAIPIVGPIIGTILQGIGIATAIGGVAAGIVGTLDVGAQQVKDTTAAQRTEQAAKMLPPADLAGKYAVSTSSALQQIN